MAGHKTALTPRSVSSHFSAEQLTGQFVLSKSPQALPWKSDSIGGWHLAVDESLPSSPIRFGEKTVGWLLGHAIGPNGSMVVDELQLQPDKVEEGIYSHGGRFVVILPLLRRVYVDPCGLLSAVYCKHLQLVASNPNLIPYDDVTEDRTELLRSIGIPYKNAMFPIGMTPRKAVERILPNHYLDLETWVTQRHWPSRALNPVEDASAAIAEIASITKQQMRAVVEDGPASLRLTAGQDSRMLLACARESLSGLECVTAHLNDEGSRTDHLVARKLSRVAGVRHRGVKWIEPEPRDLELWLFRTGFGTGAYRGWQGSTTFRRLLDTHRSEIFGTIGGLARGPYWLPDDSPDTEISVERLLDHCRCPATSETLSAGNRAPVRRTRCSCSTSFTWSKGWAAGPVYGAMAQRGMPDIQLSHSLIAEPWN